MVKVNPAKEVVITIENDVGAISEIVKTISDKGVNILAASSWVDGAKATIRLVTDDNLRVVDALRAHKYAVREADVLAVEAPHKPGMLRSVTEKLAREGLDVHHLYATATQAQDTCLVVFATSNNDRAMLRLKS